MRPLRPSRMQDPHSIERLPARPAILRGQLIAPLTRMTS